MYDFFVYKSLVLHLFLYCCYQLNTIYMLLEEKRLLGRSISTWKNNIKMDLREIGWGGMD
jgi:hypothetical protein